MSALSRSEPSVRPTSLYPAETAVVALLRAADAVRRFVAQAIAPHGITLQQYNVLRILRGHHPTRLAASDIARLMVSRDSDLTRILTDLQKRRLVSRRGCPTDRRRVLVGITQQGLAALERLDEPVVDAIRASLRALDTKSVERLIELLEPLCDSAQGPT